jgi:hypothetical protein
MLSVTMNDLAVESLGMRAGHATLTPPDGLAPGLRQRIARGIVRRGEVLTWADSVGDADGAPSQHPDLTGWECADSSFHLEDFVPVDHLLVGHTPQIGEPGQRTLLLHGTALAIELAELVRTLEQPAAVRCLISANETGATFRFHRIRRGESWNDADLDRYRIEKLIVVDIEPASLKQ